MKAGDIEDGARVVEGDQWMDAVGLTEGDEGGGTTGTIVKVVGTVRMVGMVMAMGWGRGWEERKEREKVLGRV